MSFRNVAFELKDINYETWKDISLEVEIFGEPPEDEQCVDFFIECDGNNFGCSISKEDALKLAQSIQENLK